MGQIELLSSRKGVADPAASTEIERDPAWFEQTVEALLVREQLCVSPLDDPRISDLSRWRRPVSPMHRE